MSHMHVHADSRADRGILALSLGLLLVFMVVEVVLGIVASSLALLADAGHMLTDASALGLALFAAWAASLPARGRWTFGFARAEILAAQANGITLVVIGVLIVFSAIRRLVDPPEVEAGIVTVVAVVGIAVNLVVLALMARAQRQSLNVRGAYLHIATDLAAFVGTALAAGFGRGRFTAARRPDSIESTLPGSTRTPVSGVRSSAGPPMRVATAGRSEASASRTTWPNGSIMLG